MENKKEKKSECCNFWKVL